MSNSNNTSETLAAHEAEKPSGWIPGWTFDTEALVAKLAKHGITVPPKDRRDYGVVLWDARKADYVFVSSYRDWREAEKQAGPEALPKSIDLPDDWRERAADSALAHADPETWARARGAPPSESDKEDAELTDDEIKRVHDHYACLPDFVGLKDQWPEVLRFAREVLCAARAKKEQP